jgi:hypothetical protein
MLYLNSDKLIQIFSGEAIMKKNLALFLVLALAISSCRLPGFGSKETGCGPSTLKIGEHSYQIKTIKPKKDGSLKIPANQPDTAYWVDGTETNEVFALSPTENNLSLQSSLKNGDTVSVLWQNCNSSTYTISNVKTNVPENSVLLDQSVSQVTIFARGDSSGFVAKGELAGETISTFNTPDASEKQAEISLLETSPSQDGNSIKVSISIKNYGNSAFSLAPEDVLLTAQDGTQLALTSSEPALPKEIPAGATETFNFTFPRPSTPSATLKIMTVEYDVEGY